MKIIKINTDRYIVVDDSEIKEGDWFYYKHFGEDIISQAKETTDLTNLNNPDKYFKKITHSTQPLNDNPHYADYGIITLREVKELLGEVDVEQKYNATWLRKYESYESKEGIAFKTGYNQALEDNKDKKYTEEDMKVAITQAFLSGLERLEDFERVQEMILDNIKPKTEWEVEFDENGKLKLV